MSAINPAWGKYWNRDIADIRLWLQLSPAQFVGQGIGGPNGSWATYERKANGSLRRVKSKYLPERETKEEAERDLYAWLWGGRSVS